MTWWPSEATAVSEDAEWQMLHPASVAVNLLPRTVLFLRGAWPILAVLVVRGGGDTQNLFDLTLLSFFLVMTVGRTIVHYFTLRYRLADGRLEIRSGLLNRQVRVLTPDRVQNVELVRNLFHRLSGLVEVRIETASGTEVEGELSALSVDEAARLVQGLSGRMPSREHDEDRAPPLLENAPLDLVRFGATSTRLGAAIVAIGFLFELGTTVDPERAARVGTGIGAAGMLALLAAATTGAWLVGIATVLMRHYGFALRREGEALVAEEGMFTRRRVQLAVRKVQRVTVSAPWLRRLWGFGSVSIETAAAGTGAPGVQRATAMIPVVLAHEVDRVVREAMPAADVSLDSESLLRPHPRALRRALVRGTLQGLLLGGALAWWWWPGGLVGLGVVLPMSIVAGWMDWRHQRWLVTDKVVVSRRGFINRVTTIVARDKLQSIELEQGPLLRRYGLGEVLLRVAGSGVAMPLLDQEEAFALVTRLSAAVAKPAAPDLRSDFDAVTDPDVELEPDDEELLLDEATEP